MVNRVVLIGRLTRDPNELRTSPSGVSVTSFTVAVDNRFSKQENNKADFIPVVVFNKTAEFICNYARKGALVAVEGRLQQRTYQNKENQTVNVLEVVAENVQLLESKAQSQSRQAYPTTNQGSGYSYEPDHSSMDDTKQYSSQYDLSDDDLPF
jgi:single-strand DNA-binding protein